MSDELKVVNRGEFCNSFWSSVREAAMSTIGKDVKSKFIPSKWKRRMLLCEHSPIRLVRIKAKFYNLKSWISVHLVRHHIGIEHFVKTQRSDRTGIDRDDLPQGALVEHEVEANAQAIINISRRRLCSNASKETREAWELFMSDVVKDAEPELFEVSVKDCVYRGHCYEYNSCNYHKTEEFRRELEALRMDIN